jgi:hypothetical protein
MQLDPQQGELKQAVSSLLRPFLHVRCWLCPVNSQRVSLTFPHAPAERLRLKVRQPAHRIVPPIAARVSRY